MDGWMDEDGGGWGGGAGGREGGPEQQRQQRRREPCCSLHPGGSACPSPSLPPSLRSLLDSRRPPRPAPCPARPGAASARRETHSVQAMRRNLPPRAPSHRRSAARFPPSPPCPPPALSPPRPSERGRMREGGREGGWWRKAMRASPLHRSLPPHAPCGKVSSLRDPSRKRRRWEER